MQDMLEISEAISSMDPANRRRSTFESGSARLPMIPDIDV
jgi:hypothetical protein